MEGGVCAPNAMLIMKGKRRGRNAAKYTRT
jgi:hypothetical protein